MRGICGFRLATNRSDFVATALRPTLLRLAPSPYSRRVHIGLPIWDRERTRVASPSAALWIGSRGAWTGYVIAVIVLGCAALVRILLEVLFGEQAPTFMVFLLPVIAASLLAGVRVGLVTCAAAWFIAHYFFVDPSFQFKTSSQDYVIFAVFAVEGVALALVGGRLHSLLNELVERDHRLATSEARLRMAQEAARIGTYEWEPATGRAVWSENAEAVLGRKPGSFRNSFEDSLINIIPEDRPLLDSAVEQLQREGSNRLEVRVLADSGETKWIQATGTAIRDEAGTVGRVVGVMMDVTERRRAAEHTEFLADATAQLAVSMDYRTNVAGIAQKAVPRFADMCIVALVVEGEATAELVSAVHRDPSRATMFQEVFEALQNAPDRRGFVAQAVQTGEAVFAPNVTTEQLVEVAVSEAHRQLLRELNPTSIICVPLQVRQSPLGALVFANDSSRRFDAADFALAKELGRRTSLAIENASLLEQSVNREADIRRANEALQLLADAGVQLSATLELDETLNSLARLVVPRFADVCSISVTVEGRQTRVALACSSPELASGLAALPRDPDVEPDLLRSATQVIESGRPIFLPTISDELLQRLAPEPGHFAGLSKLGFRSGIAMPLTARGQTLGVMTFLRTAASTPFDREDLSLAGQLGRRTAIAADNARLYQEARRANDAKDEFLGMMSHELRTPITVIHGGARVLRSRAEHLDDETRAGLVTDIERESERLSRMLENLLSLARAELDHEVMLEPVLLQRLLPRLLDVQVNGVGREIRLCADHELPAVCAEPVYIEQIVRNLVGNAVKYSPPDGPIEVVVSGSEGGASIAVRDRGFGVGEDEAQKIFERFYRSDRTSRLAGGAGLGLAVCKRLVEAMAGEIWATPREGGGLEVGFRLPYYKEEDISL